MSVSVAFSPDGKTIAAGYYDARQRRRRGAVGRGQRKRLADEPLAVEEGEVRAWPSAPTARPSRLGTATVDAAAWCCGTWPRKRLADEPLAVNEGDVWGVAFSPDGKTIAAGYGRRRRRAAAWCCGTWPRASDWPTSRSP